MSGLHILKSRLNLGILSKAQRGELKVRLRLSIYKARTPIYCSVSCKSAALPLLLLQSSVPTCYGLHQSNPILPVSKSAPLNAEAVSVCGVIPCRDVADFISHRITAPRKERQSEQDLGIACG
jgi:hypothetical protein